MKPVSHLPSQPSFRLDAAEEKEEREREGNGDKDENM